MFFRRGISLLPVVGFTIPLFLISAASAATSSSFQGLTASPSRVSFGNIQVGSSQTQYETLTNSDNSPVTISRATLTGGGFSFSGLSLPLSLSKGQSVTFRALFTPKLGGNTSGALAMVSDASNPNLTIALFGTGITAGQLTSSATALNFGRVTVGTSKTLTATLTATNASVTVSSVTSTSPEFRMGAFSVPTTIAAGQSASFTLTFKPQASGTSSGSISISSNAVNSPTVETLTGSGTAAPPHSVGLRWPPGPSAVVGYNVYRSATSGGPYAKINSAMNASTSYMDSSVQRATTYYYVYTVVDSSGVESKYSNQVQAVIPSP